MINIAICDDDTAQSERTEQCVLRCAEKWEADTTCFACGEALLQAVAEKEYRPDVAVLDIELKTISGIETAKQLNRLAPECRIVFLTSYIGYATDVYETRHSYFVLKPEMEKRMAAAMDRAMESVSRLQRIRFRTDGGIRTLAVGEILYLERNLRKTDIVTCRQRYTTSGKPELLMTGTEERFVHCHQSYWVNLEHITGMTSIGFIMDNGAEVPVSRNCRKAAKEAFFASLHRMVRGEEK